MEKIHLKTPDLSDRMLIGYNVGIRPFRKSGVRIETESIGNKLIIHNYGYGGSGLTLCWGGAQVAIDLLKQKEQEKTPIAILGAGVIGLSTAYELLSQGYEVTLYADKFSPHLTSNVAAGILRGPSTDDLTREKASLLDRMLMISMQRYKASSVTHEFAGIHSLFDYRFDTASSTAEKFKGFSYHEKEVTVHFDNGLIKRAKQTEELGLDGKLFIEDLCSKVKLKGGTFCEKHFDNINDVLALKESIIINCTSLGSRELFNDKDFLPIRGHLIYFKPQEGIHYSLYQAIPNDPNYWIKLYPWQDRLILGGVFETGVEELDIDHNITNHLLKYARMLFKI